ncbi:MAG: hypothetical protein II623_10345 [Paludibacteraceae bacterium]|nr:hypothetical protein [Paludibacteraceae bacterium]MBR6042593.1 hypothetical protein [Paludibacteraceae bacterium]
MENKEAFDALSEIRDMMAKSTKVLSLSGLSSVAVGALALLAAFVAGWLLAFDGISQYYKLKLLVAGAVVLFALCLLVVLLFAKHKAAKNNIPFKFDMTSRKMMWYFFLPLVVGGLLCGAVILQGHYGLTSSFMLVFYGLALVNLSGYSFSNIKYLGYAELVLGLVDCVTIQHALLFWSLGFGVFHILYGILFHFLYERKKD